MVSGADFQLYVSPVHNRVLFWQTDGKDTDLRIIGEEKDGMYRIEQRNKFSVGESIEIMKPNGENIEVTVKRIVDEEGQEQESAPHPKQVLYVDLGHEAEQYDILRRREE